MLIKVLAILLYTAQVYLTFHGIDYFSKYSSPLVLFLVSMGIPVLYFVQRLYFQPDTGKQSLRTLHFWTALLWIVGGMLTIFLGYEELRKLFALYPDPVQHSDVIPQLEAQYRRFSHGEMPYAPVDLGYNAPYPVYMPLHWLPIGLSDLFHTDLRWVGFSFLMLANGLFGYWVGRQPGSLALRIAALFLPSLGLWGFILWGGLELPVSFEIIIAAYYLVLATALSARNLPLVTLGVIFCLLSRYTLLFWLPMLAYVVWRMFPRKTSYLLWGSAALSVLLLYIIPFYLRDPDIFATGLKYHNDGAIAQWIGYGDPPVSFTMEKGIYFGINMKALFPGDAAQQVALARTVQGGIMLLLLAFGVWGYHRWSARMDGFSISLILLYLVLACFYFFSPMTFQYYLLVLFALSAVVVARIWLGEGGRFNSPEQAPTGRVE
ncbi:MAG: hypothetical protein EP344_17885 [Bacteroidetes bacterium]|nr:MAG: hypothetical protein EP344_17885 [Bacteroidota bacterium]